jgi:NAD(P)-dependent dehydrogenase (short-subunit alcohol dehydrogenase family)
MSQVWLVTGSSRGLGRAIVEPALQPVIRLWRQPETPNHLTICRTATVIR